MLGAVVVVAALLLAAPATYAQSPEPSGHWVGTVDIPTMQIDIEADFIRSASGLFSGTLSTPAEKLVGLPLSKIDVNGTSITFAARTDQRFAGILSPDGSTISGAYSVEDYLFLFTLTRMGAAKIYPVATSAPISKDLEGTWNGRLTQSGAQMRLVLRLVNHPNGGSTGSLINLDEGSLEIPIARISENASGVTLGFRAIAASYTAKMSADHAELSGTWLDDTGPSHTSLTFKRVPTPR